MNPECPEPDLLHKKQGNSDVFYWQDPSCGQFFAEGTTNPNPTDEEAVWEVIQPTITSRAWTKQGNMYVSGPIYKSVVLDMASPYTAVRLKQF